MNHPRPWPCLFAGLFLATPGLTGQPAQTPPAVTQPAVPRPATPQRPPVVTLLEAGAGPRQALRLRPKVGVTQVIELTVRIKMDQTLAGMAMPPQKPPAIRYTMAAVVNAADEGGDITYGFEYKTGDVVDEPGVSPLAAEMMRSALKAIEGLRGVGVMTDRGFHKLVRFERPPDMDARLLPQLEEMERSIEHLVSLFPSEPVGPGAVWKVQRTIDHQGMLIRQTDVVNLVAADDDRVEVRSELSQHADPQKVEAPGMPPATLQSFEARGTRTSVLRPDRVFPEASTTDLTNDATILLQQFGGEHELQQHTELRLETKTK
jgi:hypothetical protein